MGSEGSGHPRCPKTPCLAVGPLTLAINARPVALDTRSVYRGLHLQLAGEVGHRLATVFDGDSVGAGAKGDVGDGVCAVTVVLYVHLGGQPGLRADLDGQLCAART